MVGVICLVQLTKLKLGMLLPSNGIMSPTFIAGRELHVGNVTNVIHVTRAAKNVEMKRMQIII